MQPNPNQNINLTQYAQQLRKNMTKEEKQLWYQFLKKLPVNFNRQKVIERYIVDFYCASAKLVIELDGSQHYEDKPKKQDIMRDKFLQEKGLHVLRYSNLDINTKFKSVCDDIMNHITSSVTM